MKSFTRLAAAAGVAGLLAACAGTGQPDHRSEPRDVAALRFIGEQRIALKTRFGGTTVGGISGVDYDARRGDWVFVSDDRSSFDPARFYRATLRFTPTSFDGVTLTQVHYFRQGDGSTYPDVKRQAVAGGVVADIESVRVDPRDGSIWYTSEGDRRLGLDPFARQADADGALRIELPLPPMFKVHPDAERGVRNNLAFEGLSFAPDGASLWVAMEAPLYEDGPLPTPEHGALARITHVDRAGRLLGQYAYPVDAIPAPPGEGKPSDNGISEIAAIGADTLLVLERAAVQGEDGKYRNYIRLYEAGVRGATDVSTLPALAGAAVTPLAKRLVLDFNTLGLPVLDNVEAFGFGPPLPNGHLTLLFATDDNFSKNQVTQLLLFEVLPARRP